MLPPGRSGPPEERGVYQAAKTRRDPRARGCGRTRAGAAVRVADAAAPLIGRDIPRDVASIHRCRDSGARLRRERERLRSAKSGCTAPLLKAAARRRYRLVAERCASASQLKAVIGRARARRQHCRGLVGTSSCGVGAGAQWRAQLIKGTRHPAYLARRMSASTGSARLEAARNRCSRGAAWNGLVDFPFRQGKSPPQKGLNACFSSRFPSLFPLAGSMEWLSLLTWV